MVRDRTKHKRRGRKVRLTRKAGQVRQSILNEIAGLKSVRDRLRPGEEPVTELSRYGNLSKSDSVIADVEPTYSLLPPAPPGAYERMHAMRDAVAAAQAPAHAPLAIRVTPPSSQSDSSGSESPTILFLPKPPPGFKPKPPSQPKKAGTRRKRTRSRTRRS